MQVDLSMGETQRILAASRRAGLLRAQTGYMLTTTLGKRIDYRLSRHPPFCTR